MKWQSPGHHFLITFTTPQQLHPFIRSNQSIAYNALFTASSQAMKTLALDKNHIGGDLPGFFGILHTWGRQLHYHPHIHYIVPGGAISTQDQSWHPSHAHFFLPVKALSKILKAKFRLEMKKAALLDKINPEVWNIDWNVNSQAIGAGAPSIKYLAPYVFKVAITNNRILKVENHTFFRYKKLHSSRRRTMGLDVMEFIRHFLQHVLPTGFMKISYYGFLNPTSSITPAGWLPSSISSPASTSHPRKKLKSEPLYPSPARTAEVYSNTALPSSLSNYIQQIPDRTIVRACYDTASLYLSAMSSKSKGICPTIAVLRVKPHLQQADSPGTRQKSPLYASQIPCYSRPTQSPIPPFNPKEHETKSFTCLWQVNPIGNDAYRTGLLEPRIETTFQIVSILICLELRQPTLGLPHTWPAKLSLPHLRDSFLLSLRAADDAPCRVWVLVFGLRATQRDCRKTCF